MRTILTETAVLLIIAIAGITCLPQPFDGDQALFALGAEEWTNGSVYFRDFQDLKPPGIYLFYLVGGQLFGFDEKGIHLFELLWNLVFAWTVLRISAGWFDSPGFRCAAPLATCGVYYCIADTWHLTQIEWIVGLPLLTSLALLCPLQQKSGRSYLPYIAAGILGGLIGLFKPLYGILPALFWVCSMLTLPVNGLKHRFRLAVEYGVAFAFGVLIPLALAAAYFRDQQALAAAIRTMFIDPPAVLAQKTDGYGMLVQGVRWFFNMYGPLIPLTFAGTIFTIRHDRSGFGLSLIVWTVAGFLLILIQRMWWEYHYLLILSPMGLLSVRTLDRAFAFFGTLETSWCRRRNRITAFCTCLLLFSTWPVLTLHRVAVLSQFGFAWSPEDTLRYQQRQHPEYAAAEQETRFLHNPETVDDSLYVFGNPIYYHFANRCQAIPQQGWSIKVYLPDQWSEIVSQLKTNQPGHIFVANNKHEQLQKVSAETLNLLSTSYSMTSQSVHGTWYRRKAITPDPEFH
ncbi:MAG: hypothetical protein JNL58_09475 [Planctomyces sp.]|nr:hypothetical protein [Planctomyces sp.]